LAGYNRQSGDQLQAEKAKIARLEDAVSGLVNSVERVKTDIKKGDMTTKTIVKVVSTMSPALISAESLVTQKTTLFVKSADFDTLLEANKEVAANIMHRELVDNPHETNTSFIVFDDVAERDAFFVANPDLLVEDVLIAIKDTTPPPTAGTRSLDYSKSINSQYRPLLLP